MHPIHKHMSSRMKARKSDEIYDAKMAYDKKLSGKARLHYLENDIADKGMSMKSPMQNMDHDKMKGREKFNHMMVEHPAKPEPPKGSPAKESRELKDMPIVDIEKGKAKGSPAKAAKPDYIDIDGDGDKSESMKDAAKDKKKGSPAKKFDRVVFGGNKGDKSKTKPGKKDFEKKGSPAKKYDKVVLGGNKGDKSKTKPGKKDYEK